MKSSSARTNRADNPRPRRRTASLTSAAVALGLLSWGGLACLASAPAQASGPYMNTTWALDASPGGTAVYRLTQGTPVDMVCWTRGPSADGTQKWFYVLDENSPYPYGYVPANAVSNQTSTPLCG
jgi:hypothetical protein